MADIIARKTYKEVLRLPTFKERFEYLRLKGKVGKETFGWDRYFNQILYTSKEWRQFRNRIIIRDNGCDLAHPDRPIISVSNNTNLQKYNKIFIHHINPLTLEEIEQRSPVIFDPENVICVSFDTHQAIHYGNDDILARDPIVRKPNDTCPWK